MISWFYHDWKFVILEVFLQRQKLLLVLLCILFLGDALTKGKENYKSYGL